MQGIIDFHAHAFPDEVAASAIPYLEEEGDVKANHDGRIASLLDLMDRDGVEKSVICCIATRPSQFKSIMGWSKQISSERIIPFPSFHPEDPHAVEHISQVKKPTKPTSSDPSLRLKHKTAGLPKQTVLLSNRDPGLMNFLLAQQMGTA